MNELWTVFQWRDGAQPEFQGIFSTKEKAIAACRNENYSVAGPVLLDQELPDETMTLPKAWYPHLEDEPA